MSYREYMITVQDREGRRARYIEHCDNIREAASVGFPEAAHFCMAGYRIVKVEEQTDA